MNKPLMVLEGIDNDTAVWYLNGVPHREDGPAVEGPGDYREWRINGHLHRADGPAVIYSNVDYKWYLHGQLHREDGPAIVYPPYKTNTGSQYWYKNGHRHREDGPAVEHGNGEKKWFLYGVEYDPLVWMIKVGEMSKKKS